MSTPSVTPQNLTWDDIKSWDGATMKFHMRHDEMRDAIYAIIKNKPLADIEAAQAAADAQASEAPEIPPAEQLPVAKTPEEVAAEEQKAVAELEEKRVAAEQEVSRIAAEGAENESLRLAGISIHRDQQGNIVKIVQDYQATDEQGNSIGRPTHLEARNWPELSTKQKEAHVQATRAFHRLKVQKVSFKETPAQSPSQMSDAELLLAMKDLKSDDPQKQLEAIRKVQNAESDKKASEAAELHRQEDVSRRFLARHKNDFNNCKANIELVKEYFIENPELVWDDDNLEICLHALESKLAPVVESVAAIVPANPVIIPPAVTAPVTPLAVQPVVIAPAPTATPANPVVTAPRPGVNGSLEPGQGSGLRPVATAPKGLTVDEVRSWDGPTMRAKMRNPVLRPQIIAFVEAYNKSKK